MDRNSKTISRSACQHMLTRDNKMEERNKLKKVSSMEINVKKTSTTVTE